MVKSSRDFDLTEEPLCRERLGQLGAQHLERDVAIVLAVVGEEDDGHSAAPHLARDLVAITERPAQTLLKSSTRASCPLKRPALALEERHPRVVDPLELRGQNRNAGRAAVQIVNLTEAASSGALLASRIARAARRNARSSHSRSSVLL